MINKIDKDKYWKVISGGQGMPLVGSWIESPELLDKINELIDWANAHDESYRARHNKRKARGNSAHVNPNLKEG